MTEPSSGHPTQKRVLDALREAHRRLDELEAERSQPIAVIGIGCRFPGGADSPDRYWDLLSNGVDAMREVPRDRWNLDEFYDPDPESPGKMYVREAGFVDDIASFDAEFFRISPREAASLDPQQRLLLEVTWEALEDAGQSADALRGSETGFFMGLSWHDYERNVFGMNPERLDAYAGMGNTPSIAVGRLAFVLGAHGPTAQVDTACSASLVAVHLACQSLRMGEAKMVVAGGVNLMISPLSTVFCCKIRALSPDGRCKTFDASADGYARGEGCGVVVLKRLKDALADGDPIRAVIRGSAINHDGPASGLTVPNRRAQQRVIERALADARIDPLAVSYVEAHGTGTSLGDPIEIAALGDALGRNRPADRPLLVGSVKTNFGHLEAAAGIAGLIKVVLSLERGEIPPHLHFRDPSPNIDWEAFPVAVPTRRTPWAPGPRIAGVSSFGFSGTNAHVVLEAAPPVIRSEERFRRPEELLCLSAKSEEALFQLAERHAACLLESRDLRLPDVSFTLNTGRASFPERLAVAGGTAGELAAQLREFAAQGSAPGVARGRSMGGERPRIAFLFTGQGSQRVGMGRELFDTYVVFRECLERCDEILREHLAIPLLSVMFPADPGSSPLNETGYTQPALFALEWSLAELWRSWGIEPSVLLGHSVGEYAAACQGGVFSLEDGLRLIATRGRLMQQLPRVGSMVAVLCEESRVMEALAGFEKEVSLAAANGPRSMVVSGRREAVESVLERLRADGVETRDLVVSHAFHSPLMEPMLDDFEAVAGKVRKTAPRIPIVSNVTGEIAGEELTTADYWRRHVRFPVRFAAGMKTLRNHGVDVFLEIGPAPVLLGMGRQSVPEDAGVWLPSLRQGHSDGRQMLESLAQLYVRGQSIDWQGYERGRESRRVPLPTYPFQRKRFWMDAESYGTKGAADATRERAGHPLLGDRIHSAALRSGERLFESRIGSASLSLPGEHRLFDTPVVPAATYLEMALAAGASALGGTNLRLLNVSVRNVLALPAEESRAVQLLLKPSHAGHEFEISSLVAGSAQNGARWLLHAAGEVHRLSGESMDGEEMPRTFSSDSKVIEGDECYDRLREQGLFVGPGFRVIKRLGIRAGEVLAELSLPESVSAKAGVYHLHPALLEACGHAVALALPPVDAESCYFPRGWERVDLYGSGASAGWARVRVSQSTDPSIGLSADIELFDTQGAPLARIVGATSRVIRREELFRELPREATLYERVWRPRPVSSPAIPLDRKDTGRWLLFDDGDRGAFLRSRLSTLGHGAVRVLAGETYRRLGAEEYSIDLGSPSDYERLIREIAANGNAPLRGIVHLWSLQHGASPITGESLESVQQRGCTSVLYALQALVRASEVPKPQLWIVTRGTQAVGPGGAIEHPVPASLWGLGATIALEHPEIHCVRVDLGEGNGPEEMELLVQELASGGEDDQVAFRGGIRYAARLVRYASAAAPDLAFDPGASYLITGGLGGLGLQVARWLVERGARKLALVSRRPRPDARALIEELETAGAEIVTLSADVARRAELDDALRRVNALGPLRGIVHAAGTIDGSLLSELTPERLRAVMGPKVWGTWHLHEATLESPLDFFVCFSSAAALLGSHGQGNYSAANGFMDGLMHYRRQRGLPGLSINWGPWSDVGMAAVEANAQRLSEIGWRPIAPSEGTALLGALLREPAAQVGVLPLDWARFLQLYPEGKRPSFFDEISSILPASPAGRRAKPMRVAERLSGASAESRQSVLVDYLRSEVARIARLEPSSLLNAGRSLSELGLDSLMHMELRNAILSELGASIPLAEFVNGKSLGALAELLHRHLAIARMSAADEGRPEHDDTEEDEVLL